MTSHRLIASSLLILAAAAVPASADFQKDIEYGRADGERLLLDVHTPDGPGPFPVAILVHGGGWEHGDKGGSDVPGNPADVSPWFDLCTKANFVWFSINYRMRPQHEWPAGFEDTESAVRWIKAHLTPYKGDPNKIAIFGHSAGGNLAALVATDQTRDTRVQAAVLFAAASDMGWEKVYRPTHGLKPQMLDLRQPPPGMPPEVFNAAQDPWPMNHVTAHMPPTLFVGGEFDNTVAYWRTTEFYHRVRAAGVTTARITIKNSPHSLVISEKNDPSFKGKVIAWLQKTFDELPAQPPFGPDLTVAADGSGNYRTIQEAINSIATDNPLRRVIRVKEGTYPGKVRLDRANVTLEGESRRSTRIQSSSDSPLVEIAAPDCVIENLSVQNDGSRPALVAGAGSDRLVLADCDLFNDGEGTLSLNDPQARVYAVRLNIRGGSDAIRSSGPFYFGDSMIYELQPGGTILRRDGSHGKFVVSNCRFEGAKGWTLIHSTADATTDLLHCRFSPTMASPPSADGKLYFDSSYRYAIRGDKIAIDSVGVEDNLPTGPEFPPAWQRNAAWTLGGGWNPANRHPPLAVRIVQKDRLITVRYAEPVTVKGGLSLKVAAGKEAPFIRGNGTDTLTFALLQPDDSGPTFLDYTHGAVIASQASDALRMADRDLPSQH